MWTLIWYHYYHGFACVSCDQKWLTLTNILANAATLYKTILVSKVLVKALGDSNLIDKNA